MAEYFSASDLVKRSARQIKFLREKQIRIRTRMQQKGTEYQQRYVEEKGYTANEFRGIYKKDDILIFYSNDLVEENKVVEIKMVDDIDNFPQWYLESSLLQVAFYKAMLMQSDGVLTTPTFQVKEGYDKTTIKVDPNLPYHLDFGGIVYAVEVNDVEAIISHFYQKAKTIIDDIWDGGSKRVENWDDTYKFKDFETLKSYFEYKLIE